MKKPKQLQIKHRFFDFIFEINGDKIVFDTIEGNVYEAFFAFYSEDIPLFDALVSHLNENKIPFKKSIKSDWDTASIKVESHYIQIENSKT